MILMAIQHKVQDYDAWKKVFDSYTPRSRGALFHRVNRSTQDPNDVLVVTGWPSQEAAEAFRADNALKTKMKEAGVVSGPRFEFYEEVESQGS